ncbi:Fic family protein [Larkinella punicea]|uniref:Fic family protein n=1 Tax=Larkinella punicea TaxID=2315727 RepID=UPI001CA38DA5|nr:Fic family protein [Larkinella punicea]
MKAEIVLSGQLTNRTRFTSQYIQKIHKQALRHLYGFVGKWRDVNLSKGGFVFAAAHFLPNTMPSFEADILKILPNQYSDTGHLIHDLAVVHAEFLFIHLFREGNGRTARLLANLMC